MTSIAACGHGLQRAFIMSLLEELASAQSSTLAATLPSDGAEQLPTQSTVEAGMVLVIEEPELFQHPSRQRHLASILARLAADAGARIQIIYCTHSPHFVGVDRFDQVRLFRRVAVAGATEPKVTKVSFTTLQAVAEQIAVARNEPGPVDGPSLRARLVPIMTPGTSEGFFADVAVLVEGDGDRAAILAAAEMKGVDLEGTGVAVIPCSGKSNVLTVSALLCELGIATYTVWDADAHKGPTEGNCETCLRPLDKKPNPKDNHDLMRLVGRAPQDFPPLTVEAAFACFHTDLEQTLEEEIGVALFNQLLDQVKTTYGMTKRNAAIKNPRVLAAVLRLAADQGMTSPTMAAIVDRIEAFRHGGTMSDQTPPAAA